MEELDRDELTNEKSEMHKILKDLMLRIKKLEDNPREEQVPKMLEKIRLDHDRLKKMAEAIGGQIFADYLVFSSDLDHYLTVEEDRAAYRQLVDDAAILLNSLS